PPQALLRVAGNLARLYDSPGRRRRKTDRAQRRSGEQVRGEPKAPAPAPVGPRSESSPKQRETVLRRSESGRTNASTHGRHGEKPGGDRHDEAVGRGFR